MRKWLAILTMGTALALGGCAGTHTAQKGDMLSKDTVITCPKCGVEFKAGEGVEAHRK